MEDLDISDVRSRKPKTFLLVIGSCLLALLLWGAVAWNRSNANPIVAIPTPILPSPNAYNDYAAAIHALKMTIVNDKQLWIDGRPIRSGVYSRLYTPAERAALLAANAKALRLLRRGFAHTYRRPPIRSFDTPAEYQEYNYRSYATLVRLLILDSEQKAARNDWPGAMNAALDAVRLGQDILRGCAVEEMYNGALLRLHGLRQARALLAHLNAAQSCEAAQRLCMILSRHVSYSEVLQEQKWTTEAALAQLFQSADSAAQIRAAFNPGRLMGKQSPWQSVHLLAGLYFPDRRQVLADYARYMDQAIANARLPVSTAPPLPPKPNDPIVFSLLYSVGSGRANDLATEAAGAKLAMALALQAYRLDHGRLPDSLNALIPTYLQRLPDDPRATPGTSFGYRRAGTGYSLTSK